MWHLTLYVEWCFRSNHISWPSLIQDFFYIYEKLAGALHAKTRFIRPQVTITIHTSEIKHLQKYGTKQVFHFCRNTAKESVPKNLPSYLNHALQPQSLDKITWKTCEWVAVRGSGPQSHYLQCAPFANLKSLKSGPISVRQTKKRIKTKTVWW